MYASSKPIGSLYPSPYRLKDVGSINDLRPAAVNLKRSKTSVNPSTTFLYRSASMQAVTRSYSTAPQFRQYVARYRQADIPLPGTAAAAASRYRRAKAAGPGRPEPPVDQFCEFQAAPSFDLPNIATLKRAAAAADGGKMDLSWDEEHKYSSVMFEGEDGKTTVQASRLLLRDSETSSSENIRYQGMDIVTSSKDRSRKPDSNNNNRVKQKSLVSRSYYSSWEDLLEKSEVANRSNLLSRRHFGSTESINSTSSDISRHQHQKQQQQKPVYVYQQQQHELKQVVGGHHLQLHAVHNHTYQTNNNNNSTLETCLESDENDVEDDSIQLYDVPRSIPNLKKSNSRVSSSGKLCLRVESFKKEKKNSSGTQTERSSLQQARAAQDPSYKSVGHYQKAHMRKSVINVEFPNLKFLSPVMIQR